MLWPIFWMTAMLGLVVATIVGAMREKKIRAQAVANMQPQPLDQGLGTDEAGADDDAFDAGGFDDGFGDAADPLAAMDDEAFK